MKYILSKVNVRMKVLCVGFSKTGTTTMSVALGILGYKNYDFDSTFYHLGSKWINILNKGGTKEDFYTMYKDVDSSTGAPAYLFWPEILQAFPEVKLVFTMRDEESWLRSMMNHIESFDRSYSLQALAWFSPTARAFYRFIDTCSRVVAGGQESMLFFKGMRGISPTVLKKCYREHKCHVLTKAPKEQLLTYKVTDGWAPLCKFLDKPIPDVPFPHKNKGGRMVDDYLEESPFFQEMKKEFVIYLTLYMVVIAVAIYSFW